MPASGPTALSYLLVVNPKSGRGRGLSRARELGSLLSLDHHVDIVETERRGFATEVVADRGSEFDRVVAIGGDGTLNEVLGGLLEVGSDAMERPALGFLPSGTANAAAPAFDFESSVRRLAAALGTVETRPVDVGVASHAGGTRPFLLWFGAGYDAVIIETLNRERTGTMGIAGILRRFPTVLRAVHRYPAPEIRMTTEDDREERGGSVLLANVAAMAFGGTAVDSADPFDGQLDVLTFPRVSTARVAGLALKMILSSLGTARGVTHRPATHVRLESEGDVPFQLDGEPVGTLPVEVRLLPGAIRLLLT